ncbi:MAG: hypothetical protein IPO27_01125 [Bacteroidetes bacterium]|nr:hypothetical protein [Bacteroidota bacterium]
MVTPTTPTIASVQPAPQNPESSATSTSGNIPKGTTKTPSISAIGKKQEAVQAELFTQQRHHPFDLEQLHQAVKLFAEQMHATNKINTRYSLQTHLPKLQNETHIVFEFNNKVQAEQVSEVKNEMLTFIKDCLQNDIITFELTTTDKPTDNKRAYTNEEKFKEMAAENTMLNELRRRFELDL